MGANVILHHLVVDVLHAEKQCLRLERPSLSRPCRVWTPA
jgi:hypothetical protein